MEGSSDLLQAMHIVFRHNEDRVVIAFEVRKQSHPGGRWFSKSSSKDKAPRVLCLTVKRSNSSRGFKGALHVCKQAAPNTGMAYNIQKSWGLKAVASLDMPPSEPRKSNWVQINFDSDRARIYAFKTEDQRVCFCAVLRELCQQHEGYNIEITGAAPERVAEWWDANSHMVLHTLGEFAADLLEGDQEGEGSGHEGESVGREAGGGLPLVSKKEERDLEALLDLFAMGLGNVEDFQQRMQDEYAALEAANVHAILESGPAVDRILLRMKGAASVLDDLDQNLQVFDLKLRHMREDIHAIEMRNNMLEMEARNNAKLLDTLKRLTDMLTINPSYDQALQQQSLGKDSLPFALKAAWALHNTLSQLDPSSGEGLSGGVLQMEAVVDQRGRLQHRAEMFVTRAADHLDRTFHSVADIVMKQQGAGGSSTPPAGASHQQLEHFNKDIREWCSTYAPMLEVMHALKPGSLSRMRSTYCTTMNTIIRRQLHAHTSHLRSAIKASLSHSTVDADITRKGDANQQRSKLDQLLRVGQKAEDAGSDDSDSFTRSAVMQPDSPRTGAYAPRENVASDALDLGTQLHESYQALLRAMIPMLLGEAKFMAGFLLLYRDARGGASKVPPTSPRSQGQHPPTPSKSPTHSRTPSGGAKRGGGQAGAVLSPRAAGALSPRMAALGTLSAEGASAIEALLEGVESDFFALVDVTAKAHQLMCLPMLACTLRWIERLGKEPVGWKLLGHLQNAQQRLRDNFNAFLQSRVESIDRYESRKAKNTGTVKGVHVFPFVTNFPLVAHRMVILLTQVDDESPELQDPKQVSMDGSMAEGSPRSQEGKDQVMASVDFDESTHSSPVQQEVDLAYQRIVTSMFRTIERMAASDPKHGDRLRLENYSYFEESVRPFVRHVAALSTFCEQARERQAVNLERYVQQQLEYGKIWKILEFSVRVDELLRDYAPSEVPFQNGTSEQELRGLLGSTMVGADKKLASMYGRVKKHLGESPKLLLRVWTAVEDQVLQRYGRLEEQLRQCYPRTPLEPSPEELRELFKTTGPGS